MAARVQRAVKGASPVAVERTVIVQNPEGLHARPAALFVQLASRFSSEIELEARDRKSSAKSILGVLKLGVRQGEPLTIRARGDDERIAVEALLAALTGNPAEEANP
jgi:phosphocarrier protein